MFRKLKEKIHRQKLIEFEVLETLSSICLYLEFDAHFAHRGRYDDYFSSHAKQLRIFSESLRDELVKEDESLRAKYKAGSDGYKSLTKRVTLYNRAIREAEK